MATRHQVRQSVISLLYALEMNEKNENFIDEFLNEKKNPQRAKKFHTEFIRRNYKKS